MTETATAASVRNDAAIEHYLQFWNATTAEDQRRIASVTFTDDVEYHALIGVLEGPDSLMDFRNQFAGHMGAVTFEAREEPQSHHDRVRVQWEIRLAAGESFATGTDVMVVDEDGRISSVTVFLDRAPEGFDPHAHH